MLQETKGQATDRQTQGTPICELTVNLKRFVSNEIKPGIIAAFDLIGQAVKISDDAVTAIWRILRDNELDGASFTLVYEQGRRSVKLLRIENRYGLNGGKGFHCACMMKKQLQLAAAI
jgi:hypothetical protein